MKKRMEVCQKIVFILFSVFCFLFPLFSRSAFAKEDKEYGADFLEFVSTPAYKGMGDAFVSLSSGADALSSNPAGIALKRGDKFEVGLIRLPELITVVSKRVGEEKFEDFGRYKFENSDLEFLSAALPLGRRSGLGLNFTFRHEGDFSRVDSNGKAVNGFPETDMAFALTYGLKIYDRLAVGIQAKRLRSKLSDKEDKKDGEASQIAIGQGYSFDLGFIHEINEQTKFGVVVKNLGKRLHFINPDIPDQLRKSVIIGGSYRIMDQENSSLTTEIDINPPFKDDFRFNAGAEFWYLQKLALRIGYVKYVQSRSEPFLRLADKKIIREKRLWNRQGVSFGLGLRLEPFEFDLASTPTFSLVEKRDERSREETNESIFAVSIGKKF